MRIATMATGGIGGFLAVKLANAGHDVATIARGAHLEAIRKNGLRLDHADGSEVAHPMIATDRPEEVRAVDAITAFPLIHEVYPAAVKKFQHSFGLKRSQISPIALMR